MNESDLRVIEELLNKQSDRFEKRIDARLQEQSETFANQMDARFQEQSETFTKQMDARFEEQENRLDVRFQEQEERLGKRMIQVFNEGFEQVVLPHLSEMNDKIDELDSRTGRIELKIDAVVDRQDRQGEEIKSIKKFIRMPEGA